MAIEHFDFPLFHLLYSVPSSTFLIFVDKQVVTVYKQIGLLGPNKQLASQHWTKDLRAHAQGWLKKKKELTNLGQRVIRACQHALGPVQKNAPKPPLSSRMKLIDHARSNRGNTIFLNKNSTLS